MERSLKINKFNNSAFCGAKTLLKLQLNCNKVSGSENRKRVINDKFREFYINFA